VLTDEERARLDRVDRESANGAWDNAFREFQLLLDSVRSRPDRDEERRLLTRFADLLERAGDPVRARVTREYLTRGFRDPAGYARLRARDTGPETRDRTEGA
jgi:hypothetical protein